MKFTLKQLEIFKKLSELKNYSKTADVLFMTQPGVSIQIKQLSESLSLDIVQIIGRKVHITKAGLSLIKEIDHIIDSSKAIEKISKRLNNELSGEVTIAVDPIVQLDLFNAIFAFTQEYTKIKINIDVCVREAQVQKLQDHKIDFVILGNVASGIQMDKIKLFEYQSFLVAPINSHFSNTIKLLPKDLKDETFIVGGIHNRTRQIIMKLFKPKPENLLIIGNGDSHKYAVSAGLGLAILHQPTMNMKNVNYKILDIDGLPVTSEINIATRSTKLLDPISKLFWDFLIDFFQKK